MTIDTSGKWWKGTSAKDITSYLEQLFASSYPIHEHRLSVCECGSEIFSLHWIPDEGAVRRTCAKCGKKKFVCDSEENWEGRPKKYKCIECKSETANLGVAFALCDDKSDVRWIYVGYRCANCGVLGSFADWKVGDSDGERSCQHHDEREQSAISGPSSKPWAQNMKCSKCGSLIVNGPAEKSALEIWQCEKCESEFAVHCHYLPDLSGIQARGLFTGTAFISSGAESLKALLKLKNKLAFAERFEPTKLEEQQRAGKLAWDIGYFLDFEVERASAACVSAGVSVRFSEVN